MPIPSIIQTLISRFDANAVHYRHSDYNETETRREFIDPLFKALGWDVDNTQGYSEKYKEVVHEARVKVGRATKAPDYAFRVGGHPVFFVEAKKPALLLREDADAAYQVRRYAWSAKLPLSILTNFAEFAVYDCRFKPVQHDKAGTARVLYLTYDEYPERWDELRTLFSPEAIRTGAFDRYVDSAKAKRGTQAVDDAFLAEIEQWREALARNFALRNTLTVRQLNFVVQKTIDRVIFLRIAEDRGFEPYHRLGDVAEGQDVYAQLGELFRQADNRYNAGLFHFQADSGHGDATQAGVDDFTLDLRLDDKVIKPIIANLYYPDSPYAFDALPADILGQVYERFLGSVVRLTPTGRAKVEEKPEVRKAGGVYYTPTYIVDYIVEHTVGALVRDKTYRQVRGSARTAPLRVLDPACGSGTFLLQAYQYLLDWYLAQYVEDDAERHARAGRLVEGAEGWRLTTEERKAVLLTHVYGVDIDPQAVEVTKLSLLLKVLEGEDEESLGTQLAMSIAGRDRVLPDLGRNIRCGNSLIGSDFYEGEQLSLGLVDEAMMYRVNAFDWDAPEGFGKAMAAGGFDAVIGNPPYGALFSEDEKAYLKSNYSSMVGKFDSYGFFIEKGVSLLKNGGFLGYIVPHTWLTITGAESLRCFILDQVRIIELDRLPTRVFQQATVNTILVFLERESAEKNRDNNIIRCLLFDRDAQLVRVSADSAKIHRFSQEKWRKTNPVMFNIDVSSEEQSLLDKINENNPVLHELCNFCVGIQAYDSHTGQARSIIKNRAYHSDHKKDKTYKRELNGKDVARYYYKWPGNTWVSYGKWLAHPRQPHFFDGKRLLVREITSKGRYLIYATFVDEDFINYKSILNVKLTEESEKTGYDILYVLGIINSAFMSWYFPRASNKLVTRTFPRISILDMKRFRVRAIDFDDPDDVARHDKMVALVERMLELHRNLAEAKTPQAKRLLKQQITVTDRAIDALVYELYGLTEDEIAIVEGV